MKPRLQHFFVEFFLNVSTKKRFLLTPFILLVASCANHSQFDYNSDQELNSQKNHARSIEAEISIDAPIDQVWKDWSTKRGQESFFGGVVSIDLTTNGRYDVWFLPEADEGQRGQEDGRIIAVDAPYLLTFTWTMPPYMPKIRPHHTFIQVHFERLSANQTKILLSHTGFGVGEHWDQGYDYFVKTWPAVLSAYQQTK